MGAAVLLLLLGGAVACGGDDDSDTSSGSGDDTTEATEATGSSDELRQQYVDAVAAIWDDEEDERFSVDDRRCVAESFVDAYGVEEIEAAGVTPDDIAESDAAGPGDLELDLSEEQRSSFSDQMTGCLDLRALVGEVLGADGEMPPEVVACLDENLTDDLLVEFFTTGFTEGDAGFEDDPALEEEFNAAVSPCMAQASP
jgi:hypothetical protein